MAGYFPTATNPRQWRYYPEGSTASGATVTANGSANTKGNYTELVAATPYTTDFVTVVVNFSNTGGLRFLLDLAIGAAGAEVVIAADLLAEGPGSLAGQAAHAVYALPCQVPSGTRLAVRCQCSTGGSTINVAVGLGATAGLQAPGRYVTYGANTADSGGVAVDPGGSVNTKGAYSEITAATSAEAAVVGICCTLGGNVAPASAVWSVDLATGGSGSEVPVVSNLRVAAHASQTSSPTCAIFPLFIPAGTRLAVRASCSITDVTDRLLDVAILTAQGPIGADGGGLSWAPISVVAAAGASLVRAIASGAGLGRA